jgi:hypothetical protein
MKFTIVACSLLLLLSIATSLPFQITQNITIPDVNENFAFLSRNSNLYLAGYTYKGGVSEYKIDASNLKVLSTLELCNLCFVFNGPTYSEKGFGYYVFKADKSPMTLAQFDLNNLQIERSSVYDAPTRRYLYDFVVDALDTMFLTSNSSHPGKATQDVYAEVSLKTFQFTGRVVTPLIPSQHLKAISIIPGTTTGVTVQHGYDFDPSEYLLKNFSVTIFDFKNFTTIQAFQSKDVSLAPWNGAFVQIDRHLLVYGTGFTDDVYFVVFDLNQFTILNKIKVPDLQGKWYTIGVTATKYDAYYSITTDSTDATVLYKVPFDNFTTDAMQRMDVTNFAPSVSLMAPTDDGMAFIPNSATTSSQIFKTN